MTQAPNRFEYGNLPERHSGPFLAAAGRLLPGIGRVQAQVVPYADAWRAANATALAGSGPLWVVLGDSLSQGIGASRPERGWVGQARAVLADHGRPFRVLNLSVSGTRTGELLARQVPALEELAAAGVRADLVTVLVGSNDLFSRERRATLPATFTALLERLPVGRLGTVVATLPNPTRAATAVNAVVHRVAGERGLAVAETRRPETTHWRGKLSADHFHPNDAGYASVATVFTDAILGLPDLDG